MEINISDSDRRGYTDAEIRAEIERTERERQEREAAPLPVRDVLDLYNPSSNLFA